MLCFAPLVLVGYAVAVETSWHHEPHKDINAPMIEVQTCDRGLGAHVKASEAGFYGAGLQYGFQWTTGKWTATLTPQAGMSYVDHPMPDRLPMRTQFEVGGQFLIGYRNFRIGIEYWHLSDAHLKLPNDGVDMMVLQTGWAFN